MPQYEQGTRQQISVTRAQGSKAPWVHTDEGDDDMPAHVKSSMFGASVSVPISNGRLNLGTWQVRDGAVRIDIANMVEAGRSDTL